jgi:predicted DNA-binding transcriptional regulator AlpA
MVGFINLSITQIFKITGLGHSTSYRVLEEKLNYIPYSRIVKDKLNN